MSLNGTMLERAQSLAQPGYDDDCLSAASTLALVSIAESLDKLVNATPVAPDLANVVEMLKARRDGAIVGSRDDSLNGDLAAARAVAFEYAIKLLEGVEP